MITQECLQCVKINHTCARATVIWGRPTTVPERISLCLGTTRCQWWSWIHGIAIRATRSVREQYYTGTHTHTYRPGHTNVCTHMLTQTHTDSHVCTYHAHSSAACETLICLQFCSGSCFLLPPAIPGYNCTQLAGFHSNSFSTALEPLPAGYH